MRLLLLAGCMIVFFLPSVACSQAMLHVNEIHPETPEWVELFNDGSEEINISEWLIRDNWETDRIGCYAIPDCSIIAGGTYLLVIGRDTEISSVTNDTVEYFYVEDSRIGNGISANDSITISFGSSSDSLAFEASPGTRSWGRFPEGSSELVMMEPSPGRPNQVVDPPENGSEPAPVDECDLAISIEGGQIFTTDAHRYAIIVDGEDGYNHAEVEYWIEDVFGGVVRPAEKTNNTGASNAKSWTPPDAEGSEGYVIRALISGYPCNDGNSSNDHSEKVIVAKGSVPSAPAGISAINVTGVNAGSDGKAKFGDAVKVSLDVYKGDTSKSSVEVRAEDSGGRKIAEISFSVQDKFTGFGISVPLRLDPNCGGEFAPGTYAVIADGLGASSGSSVLVDGNSTEFCKVKAVETQKPCPQCSCQACQPCKCENKTSSAKTSSVKEAAGASTSAKAGEPAGKTGANNAPKNITKPSGPGNGSSAGRNPSETRIPTGKMSSGGSDWFSSAIGGFVNFFKNLFKL